MHLASEFGSTIQEIESHGLTIHKKIDTLLFPDTPIGISESMGMAQTALTAAFTEYSPNLLIVCGDRFETLAAALAAVVSNVPIAHIHGGESTLGAMDDAFRHAITKMSHLHFTSTNTYKQRVIQMGENHEMVFNVGSLGVENIAFTKKWSKSQLETALGFKYLEKNILVTFHPVTLENQSQTHFEELLISLKSLKNTHILFTKANADPHGRQINKMIDEFVTHHTTATAISSLGQDVFYSCLSQVDAVVGNSSSGIIEAPSFKIGTINIGNRQKGRVQSTSVLNCPPKHPAITATFKTLYSKSFQQSLHTCSNPYEKLGTCNAIINQIKKSLPSIRLEKPFIDYPTN